MKALITGASAGIGRDMARELANRGIDLILVSRRLERMQALRRELAGKCRVQIIVADLADADQCRRLYQTVKDQAIDILINNAGLGVFGPFASSDLEQELRLLNVDVRAVHMLTKLFLPDFIARDSGHILNVASSAAFLPGPLLAGYYGAKAYVLRLSLAVAEELRQQGSRVKISILCPGPTLTEFNDVAGVQFAVPSLSCQYVARYGVKHMLRGKLLIIPGLQMKLAYRLLPFVPVKWLLPIAYHLQHRKGE